MAGFVGWGPDAARLGEQMQDAWISFTRTGRPAADGLPAWPAYESGRRATMVLDGTSRVEDAPMEPERAYWDKEA